MTQPYIQEFNIAGTRITSVVLDADEFESVVRDMRGLICGNTATRADDSDIQRILESGQVTMGYGVKTKRFFERFNVKSEVMGLIRRGLIYTGPLVWIIKSKMD